MLQAPVVCYGKAPLVDGAALDVVNLPGPLCLEDFFAFPAVVSPPYKKSVSQLCT